MKGSSSLLAAAAAFALTLAAASPARAQGCWADTSVWAAQLRDLQTLMMVGALRCRATADNLLDAYNGFISRHRALIQAHNDALKTHFGARNISAYDRFTTALANDHAGRTSAADFCARVRALAERAAAAETQGALAAMAEAETPAPRGVNACTARPVTIAAVGPQ